MVDIAAQLSLTASGPAIDPGAIIGAETADSQAFGNILAGQEAGNVQANTGTGAPATRLPPFPVPAGNRQPGGKILPGAAQILPDAVPLGVEAPTAQILPTIAAIPGVRLVTTPSLTKLVPQPHIPVHGGPNAIADAAASKQAEASPVHGLIKMLAAALKGQRPAAAQGAEDAPAAVETVNSEAMDAESETPEQATPVVVSTAVAISFPLPVLAAPVATPAATASGPDRTALLVSAQSPSASQQIDAALREQIQSATAQALGQSSPAQSVQAQQVQVAAGAPTEAPADPVLNVAAAPGRMPAAAVTLVAAPSVPAGEVVSARIKVAAPAADQSDAAATADRAPAVQPPLGGREVAADPAAAVSRTVPAMRTVLAERSATDRTASPFSADSQAPLPAAAPVASAPMAAAAGTAAPAVEMPRQDFAALVERLVEARNASAPQSTHASLNHAEFGQVSLHFQQDGGDLKVAMSSADPDFARAAQAAQAAQPAERQNSAPDTNARGQSQGQSQNQSTSANSSSHSHYEAAGRDAERSEQQSRNSQGRNSRGGNNSSNPSPRSTGHDQSQTRGGIFA